MKHGFIKVASAYPEVTVADCKANLSEILKLHTLASDAGIKLLVFPELCLTGATCKDLFFSEVIKNASEAALLEFVEKTDGSDTISIIGFPLFVNDKIYNCAAICQNGNILGIVPKKNLSYSEKRYFSEPFDLQGYIPVGDTFVSCEDVDFTCDTPIRDLSFSVVIGDRITDCKGAIVANLRSDAEIVGASEYRKGSAKYFTAENVSGMIMSCAGKGESTTDLVFGGHGIIAENGEILAERAPFSDRGLLVSEIDVKLLASERRRNGTSLCCVDHTHSIDFDLDECETELTRHISSHPFIPDCKNELASRCERILDIQATGLAQRIVKAYAKKAVIGISGGLDSCLALLVAIRAMDILERPHTDVIGVTMPCFGTTKRTRSNAELLCQELGCELRCVNIADAVRQHFSDIGHDESNRNVVYENSQARERTQVIMDIANIENGFVVGTGDLSELALGWATYNGDHMSMYGVNGGVPKTLIRKIVSYCADDYEGKGQSELAKVLRDIVDTPVSPELLPADDKGNIAQITEDLVGPYEIHDFYIYYTLRYGFAPDKLYRMARMAFKGAYDDETLLKWLKNFARRFFAQQFKRSCLPDGPKVGSVGVSPRGDLSMPSDASSAEWLRIIEKL